MDNIIDIELTGRSTRRDQKLWQYDYGQVLRIAGKEFPKVAEVQFSLQQSGGHTLDRIGTSNNGLLTVQIPNELLQNKGTTSDYTIYAFVYLSGDGYGNTKYMIQLPVESRPEPTDPSEDPSVDPSIFEDAINAVNASAERAETAEKSAKESADKAKEYAESAGKSKEDVEKARDSAISAIGIEKESALRGIESKTVESLQKIQSQTEASQNSIKQSIADATEKKTELDGAISNATDAKGNLDKAVQSAGNAKTELDASVGKAKEAKTTLDATVERANTVDGSLKEHIGSAEQIQANVEQIGKNTQAISLLNEEIGELPNNIVSSTDSFVQYNYTVKSGEKHRFGLFDYSGDYFKQCEIYLFKGDNSYKQIGILRNVGEFIDYDVADNYVFVRYVFQTTEPESKTVTKRVYSHISTSNSLSDEVEENRQVIFKNAKAIATNNKSIDKVTSTVNDFKSFIGEKKEEVYTITSSPTWEKTEITLVKNAKYDISVEKNDNIKNVMLYDTGYNIKEMIYNRDQGLTGISYTTTENFTAMLLVYLVDESISTDVKLSIKSGLMGKDEISKDDINVLIIGDSYSALGNWVNELSKMVNINNLVNLGVSSATLKDKHKDTTLYPYTSRPVMISSDGNLNVFHNQILKLKRLMDGTDLDSGESKIYTTPDEYPDVIFIEGGTNDNADSATNDYQNILYNQKKCYVKYGENDIRDSNAYIKKDMSDVDKTTFVGALAYLYSELHVIFPKAKIIMISPCGLSYPNGNNMDCITIDNQLTEASKYFAMPVVHWLNTGVSYYNIPVSGDGTENNPYSIADTTDTKDWLHPTSDSANKLAKEVYAELKKYFNV